jgi:subtilisin family serine protease
MKRNRAVLAVVLVLGAMLALVYHGYHSQSPIFRNDDFGEPPSASKQGKRSHDPISFEVEKDEVALEGDHADKRPAGRFADYVVIDRVEDAGSEGAPETTVFYLLEGASESVPFVLLEERFEWSESEEKPVLSQQIAAKGDEIMFDANPALVEALVLASRLEEIEATISWKSRLSDFVQIRLNKPSIGSYLRALDSLRQSFPESTVSQDHLHFQAAISSEYSPALLWHLDQVNAAEAWSIETGSEDRIVAIIDTGCSIEHPDLVDNIFVNPNEIPGNGVDDDSNGFVDDISGWDFVDDDANPNDVTGHGTHVSGIAGARGNNGIGGSGVGWGIKILPLKVGDAGGLSSSAIAESLRYVSMMWNAGVKVVATNNSYGSAAPNDIARSEIQTHENLGIVFVAAAGNSGEDIDAPGNSQYPAGFPESNVISVASSTQGDELSSGTNFGAKSVDLAAPGQEIYSTSNNDDYEFLTGTSMSSPIVAGAVALLSSLEPDLNGAELKTRILETVTIIESMQGKTVTGGRLDLLAALDPELKDFRLRTPSHPGHLILLPDISIPVELTVETLEDADVSVEIAGSEEGIAVVETPEGGYVFQFSEEGSYRVPVSATKNGVVRETVKQFLVGAAGDVRDGLIHSWEMEGSGSSLIDSAGRSNGEFQGSSRVAAPLGKGVDFSGASSRVRFEAQATSVVTISAFVRSDDLLSSPHPRIVNMPDYYLYFSTRGTPSPPDGNANTLKFYSNRDVEFGVWNSLPDTVVESEWLHVLATYDSTEIANTPRLFINGQEQIVRVQRLPIGNQTLDGGESFLGDRDTGDRAWDGQMDEVRVYDRVLDSREVSSLSARYAAAYWNQFSIFQRVEKGSEDQVTLELKSVSGDIPTGEFEWSLVEEIGGLELRETGTHALEITASEKVNTQIRLKVDGVMGSRYYLHDLLLDPPEISPGIYTGTTDSGGTVWIEVDDDERTGYITILDTVSRFSRSREPIVINAFGEFSASSELDQLISGEIDGGISGRVSGLNIEFAGEPKEEPASLTSFQGFYEGGLVGKSGESVELRVLQDGSVFVWLNGSELDLAKGALDGEGVFDLESQSGVILRGSVVGDSRLVSGSVTRSLETVSMHLKNENRVSDNRYVNLSTRGLASSGDKTLIGGFVLAGEGPRKVLIRGLGPDLSARGVSSFVVDPVIKVFRGTEIIAENDDWETNSNLDSLIEFSERVGASALARGSQDAAYLGTLQPGLYTVFLESENVEGEGLFEVFDSAAEPERSLFNVSTRGFVDGREIPLIAGFVVLGSEPKKVLIRAVGPGLAALGVNQPLEDPAIVVYEGDESIASNDNWSDASAPFVEGQSVQGPARFLMSAFDRSGAFPLELGSRDASLLIWLEPGLHTAVVNGEGGSSGVALVEVYEVD